MSQPPHHCDGPADPGCPDRLSAVSALSVIDSWPVPNAAAVVTTADGTLAAHGDVGRVFPLASVTKLLTAQAALLCVEDGTLSLDMPAGPPGATLKHLLAHASGLSFEGGEVQGAPGSRRIYSNGGYALIGDLAADRSGFPFHAYLREAVFAPLGMAHTALDGHAGHGGTASAADIAVIARELLRPTLLAADTHALATAVAYPGLNGVLPGYGGKRPNDWGLGPEIRGHKSPHWTSPANSPATVGHFGQAGTFCWADPAAGLGLVVLTDRAFGEWAKTLWPEVSTAVLAEWAPQLLTHQVGPA